MESNSVHINKSLPMMRFMLAVNQQLHKYNIHVPGVIDDFKLALEILPERVSKEKFISAVNYQLESRKKKVRVEQDATKVWIEPK